MRTRAPGWHARPTIGGLARTSDPGGPVSLRRDAQKALRACEAMCGSGPIAGTTRSGTGRCCGAGPCDLPVTVPGLESPVPRAPGSGQLFRVPRSSGRAKPGGRFFSLFAVHRFHRPRNAITGRELPLSVREHGLALARTLSIPIVRLFQATRNGAIDDDRLVRGCGLNP